uniref:BolA domain-containing protein n=1 Tax=Coccidioides posadasii RMSCC 3488 TaxID=454284 RepID=A0A0J6FJU3_COCPO|nr:hypothetical protein CPAG_05427 [Coccidioides posadasii RMSCC 3488]
MLRPLSLLRQHRLSLLRSVCSMSAPPAGSAAPTPSNTPMEDAIRAKIQAALLPTTLTIRNDSHKHAHHAPMRGVTSKETHFKYTPFPTARPFCAPGRRTIGGKFLC